MLLLLVWTLIVALLTHTAFAYAKEESKLGVYLRIIANHIQMLTALATIDYAYGWSNGALKLL